MQPSPETPSRRVFSGQTGAHASLGARLRRHANTAYRRPVAERSRDALALLLARWRGASPLVLDAGCGVGRSTIALARRHPDCFVVGIDKSEDRLSRGRPGGEPPDNCLLLRADLVDLWRLLRSSGIRLAFHYLLYPNPWPKLGHVGRRWHGHPVFPDLVALGGVLECRSNWRVYVEEFAAALAQLVGRRAESAPFVPCEPLTPFEAKYLASGHTLWRCRADLDAPA